MEPTRENALPFGNEEAQLTPQLRRHYNNENVTSSQYQLILQHLQFSLNANYETARQRRRRNRRLRECNVNRRTRLYNDTSPGVIAGNHLPIDFTTDTGDIRTNQTTPQTIPAGSFASTSNSIDNHNKISTRRSVLGIECPVCLDTLREPTATLCGHVFCEECIKGAIVCSNKCPLCKHDLSLTSLHPLYI